MYGNNGRKYPFLPWYLRENQGQKKFNERVQRQDGLWLLRQTLSVLLWWYRFNLPPMTIDESYRPNKRSHYNPDPLPDDIYVASEKYILLLWLPLMTSHKLFSQVLMLLEMTIPSWETNLYIPHIEEDTALVSIKE